MRGTPAALKAAEEIFRGEGWSAERVREIHDTRVQRIATLIDMHHRFLRETSKGVLQILINNDCEAAKAFREAVKETFNI